MQDSATNTENQKNIQNNQMFTAKKDKFMTIVKRNGMMVPFSADRIFRAVELAVRHTNDIERQKPLSEALQSQVFKVTDLVVEEVKKNFETGNIVTVERVQDIVEMKLMEAELYEVAKNYIIYRDDHKQLRDDSPRNIKIARRSGNTVRFNPIKIFSALEKAFRATRNIEGQTPRDTIDVLNNLTNKVIHQVVERNATGEVVGIESIQDIIERELMSEGYFDEAKDYIIFRSKQTVKREPQVEEETTVEAGQVFSLEEGDTVSEQQLREKIEYAAKGLDNVDPELVLQDALKNFYQGIKEDEIKQTTIMSSRAKVEKEPNYTYLTSRLLLDNLYQEAINTKARDPKLNENHGKYFKEYLERGIELERISPDLMTFDLDKLTDAMDLSRDLDFTYLGLQTLYDRYFIHEDERRVETPQIFWMRVAMGLAIEEDNKNDRAIEFYDLLSQFYFVSSTPTLFNSGTCHSQMSSCYLSTTEDNLSHIFKVVADDAQLSKWAGGLGNDWTYVRATGSRIKGTNGRSQGVIPFLKVANDTAVAVNQGGKRKGAMCAYLESWHLDIEDFLELRKNTGDERRRTHDMNTANWIPDLFMKRVQKNETWTLFSPDDVPDLHDSYGKDFEEKYAEYERKTETGEITLYKKIEALTLWRKMLSMLFETGHPWITFKDPSNVRSPQDHQGVVHSSNLCTEILLNTSKDETAVCNLGSLNLVKHMTKDGLDENLMKKSVKTAIRMLDNVININFYPIKEAQNSNMKHRPIGLGLMGFQDCLYMLNVSYASPEAVTFSDRSMEMVSYYAILASSELAGERGVYESYKGSKWDRGILPIDSIDLLAKERGEEYLEVDTSTSMDWDIVRKSIKKNGMRNSNTMAIAPTATISNISGVTQSIEPSYKHLFVKSNLSGEFVITNTYLVDQLKSLGVWDDEMIDDLKYFDGSVIEIERIPDDLKKVYLTSFEIDPEWMIECASRRQKWIDMGQSLNLYMAEPSGKKLHEMYMDAWKKGLKTTYYLRSLGATQIEKSTTDVNKRGLQPRWMKNKSASSTVEIERKDKTELPAQACNLDGDCESCQ